MFSPENSIFTHSGSSKSISIFTSMPIALNISFKNVLILFSISSLDITVVYFDTFSTGLADCSITSCVVEVWLTGSLFTVLYSTSFLGLLMILGFLLTTFGCSCLISKSFESSFTSCT